MEGSEKEEDAEEILQKEGLVKDEDDYSDDYSDDYGRGHDQKLYNWKIKQMLAKLNKHHHHQHHG